MNNSGLGNNNGVALVKHGEYEGAIIEFTSALELLRPLLAGSFSSSDVVPGGPQLEQDEEMEVGSTANAQETNTPTPQTGPPYGPSVQVQGKASHSPDASTKASTNLLSLWIRLRSLLK